jgi:inner membrane protein
MNPKTEANPEPLTPMGRTASKVTNRLLGILLVIVPLWGAAGLVNQSIGEREDLRTQAEKEISDKWGNDQVLSGPVLVIPWDEIGSESSEESGRTVYHQVVHRHSAAFLPEHFQVEGSLRPEIRRRGIFETVLYVADLDLKGDFAAPDLRSLGIDPAHAHMDKAFLSMGLTDTRGLVENPAVIWKGRERSFAPGPGDSSPFSHGFQAKDLGLGSPKKLDFHCHLILNGSRTLKIAPVGRISTVNLRSPWPDPSFCGDYLPTSRNVGAQGFQADWKVLELARDFPQAWRDQQVDDQKLNDASFGVGLIRTASTYQQSGRATKYAILFLVLTYSVFFLFEARGGSRVHPIQYLLVGAALVVFYLLLLSLSEQLGFNVAYGLSSAATLMLIWSYVRTVLGDPGRARLLLAVLSGLYGYLFVILRLDDYALLMGSVAIFGSVAALMWLTRNIDWYALDRGLRP